MISRAPEPALAYSDEEDTAHFDGGRVDSSEISEVREYSRSAPAAAQSSALNMSSVSAQQIERISKRSAARKL